MDTYWLKELATLREDLEKANKFVEEVEEELKKTPIYQALETYKEMQAGVKKQIDEVTARIKEQALEEYDGENKKPYSGVEIRNFTIVNVLDEKQAKVWAAENAPSTLNISKSKFEKVVKVLELDFIELGEENRVYLASDLSEYLEE